MVDHLRPETIRWSYPFPSRNHLPCSKLQLSPITIFQQWFLSTCRFFSQWRYWNACWDCQNKPTFSQLGRQLTSLWKSEKVPICIAFYCDIHRNQNSWQKLVKADLRNSAVVQVGAYLSVIDQDVLDDRVPNGFPINHPHIVHLVPTDLPVLSARHRRPPQHFNRRGVDSLHLDFTRWATRHWENYGIEDKKVKLKEDTSRPTGHLSWESGEADKNLQNGYIPLTSTG